MTNDPAKLEAGIAQGKPVAHPAQAYSPQDAIAPQQVQVNVPPAQMPYYNPGQMAPQIAVPQQMMAPPQQQFTTTQPVPSQVVYVNVQSPTNRHDDGIVRGRWKTGVCDCFQDCIPNFWMAWCCPCISYAQTSYRMTGSYICAMLTYILCCGMPLICLRGNVRARFSIPGNFCEDLCCACFCTTCALTQVAAHTESYTPGSCSFGTKGILPAYNQA